MTTLPLSGLSILVVEGKNCEASDLRSSLIRLGANVHVVRNVHTGLMVATRKRIHGAVLDCVSHGASLPLCAQLAINRVPFMFYGGTVGKAADDEASCIAELIAIQERRDGAQPARRLQFHGSGDDRYQTTM
jgi:hypothetical protein